MDLSGIENIYVGSTEIAAVYAAGQKIWPVFTELHGWNRYTDDVPLGVGLIGITDSSISQQYIYMRIPSAGKWFFGVKLLTAPQYYYEIALAWEAVFDGVNFTRASFVENDSFWIAYDGDNQQAWGALNNDDWNGDESADPETGVGGVKSSLAENMKISTLLWGGHANSKVEALIHPPQWTRSAPSGFNELVLPGEYA